MRRRHALVTGGAGFIGSHLSEHLLDHDWKVTVLDDLSTGSIVNVRHLEDRDDFRMLVGDCADETLMRGLCADVDAVFHLAAVVGVSRVMENTVATIEKNLHGAETVLRVCNLYRLRLLVTSTSEVYGASSKERFSETDDSIIGPSRHRRWSYAAAKLMDEFHAFAYFYSTALPVTIVRLFNTIGPRQVGHYGMVVPTFVRQALAGDPVTVFGDGSQRRCFTWVGDVVRAMHDLVSTDDAVGEVYNIGGTEEISIMELAERIVAVTGSDSEIVTRSYRDAYGEDFVDMDRRVPDVTRLRDALGSTPDTPLDEMLAAVIDHMRNAPGRS